MLLEGVDRGLDLGRLLVNEVELGDLLAVGLGEPRLGRLAAVRMRLCRPSRALERADLYAS